MTRAAISDEIVNRAMDVYLETNDSFDGNADMRAALEAVADDVHKAVEREIRERFANDPAAGWPC